MGIRVLIADDHVLVRQSLRSYLETEQDLQVVGEASNGREVLAMMGEAKTRPDVVLLDVRTGRHPPPPGQATHLRKSDKAFLAAASRMLRREARGAFLVRPETLLRWHRQLVRRKWTDHTALPAVRPLIPRFVSSSCAWRENPRWGYQRIRGELLKLGVRVSPPRSPRCSTVLVWVRPHDNNPAKQ